MLREQNDGEYGAYGPLFRDRRDSGARLAEPEPFFAVGLYYEHFAPTEDVEVQRILQESLALRQRAKEPTG